MSNRSNVGGWLRGTIVRKGNTGATHARSSTPMGVQVQNTSTTLFGGGVKDPSGRVSEYFSMDDQCPVCKSDRYLNPKLRLLVSSCYHKMCESCIDRLFTLGPAPCPECGKTLRKLAFTPQTFEDLHVEKEVAIRRRIAKEFNKRREDFLDLRSYNDYLEEVEDITFNLINGINIKETEEKIAALRAASAAMTEANLRFDQQYAQSLLAQEEADRQERQRRAALAQKEEEEERAEKERERQHIIELLQNSDLDEEEAKRVVRRAQQEAKAKSEARKKAEREQARANAARARAAKAQGVVPDTPHVPLRDNYYDYRDKYSVLERYDDPVSEAVRRDREGIMRAGGYRLEEAWERALRSAVAGLDLMPLTAPKTTDTDVVMASA